MRKLDAAQGLLVVVDMQERLLPAMHDHDGVQARVQALMKLAGEVGVPVLCSEQYPKGLGPTVEAVRADAPADTPFLPKVAFSCMQDEGLVQAIQNTAAGRRQAIVVGVETHVCVLQTALDLAASGLQVFVVADAAASRRPSDKAAALDRLRDEGVRVVTTEMVLFEWVGQAGTPAFKQASALVKSLP